MITDRPGVSLLGPVGGFSSARDPIRGPRFFLPFRPPRLHAEPRPHPQRSRDRSRRARCASLEPVVHAHGAEVVDIEFRPERGGWVLRVFVEKAGAAEPGAVDARRGRQPRALRERLARPQPRARRRRPHPPRVPARGELAGRRAPAPDRARLRPLHGAEGASSSCAADRGRLGWRARASWALLDGVADGQVRVVDGKRTHEVPLSSIESARLVFEFGSQRQGMANARPAEEALRATMAIQQQQTGRRSDPPSGDRDGREGQGDRQGAPRQDGRRGDPQGRAERVRRQPRARGALQRGHRPGRPLPVHDRRRRRVRRRARDRARGRAAARPRGGAGRGARLPDLLAPVGREEGRRAGQGVRRHPAREAGAPGVRPHRRADREAGAHPARPRRGARPHLQRVQGPQGRAHQGRRPALREGQQPHRRPRPHRGHPARSASRRRARPTARATASSPT